ncbi:MAG: prepilin-type N-terminal cleavage/methylation domain-containing protein [Deltaproteobacteria bacterium]|nr:prepilin-type N-terminal cleavage/methylation domain-containing protein [Deltaproteobacteria bacterium]
MRRRGHRAFTLIELILTMTIVSGGLFGLLATFDAASRGSVHGQVMQTALLLAQDQLERMTADKTHRGYNYIIAANYPASGTVTVGTHQYTRLVAIQEVQSADLATPQPGSGYKRIDVTIFWAAGAVNQVALTGLLSL